MNPTRRDLTLRIIPDDPVPGLYEQLVTEELKRLLAGLEPARVDLKPVHVADAHVAVADYLRRISCGIAGMRQEGPPRTHVLAPQTTCPTSGAVQSRLPGDC